MSVNNRLPTKFLCVKGSFGGLLEFKILNKKVEVLMLTYLENNKVEQTF